MVTMMLRLFWGSLGLLVYTYLAFPALAALRGRLVARPVRSAPIRPAVTLVIAARNEATGIGAKLENIAALDYPADRLDVIVASDGSDDGTDAIVEGHERGPHAVRLLRRPREGKAAALNAAVAEARGEILVFSDANSRYEPDAIVRLVEPFADPEVGGVAGNQVYERGEATDGAVGERAYWGYDRVLKSAESRGGSVISATGAIYAVRRDLVRPIPAGVTDDFYNSAGVIAQGYRLVFAPDAIAWEPAAASGRLEFQRKVRVMTRGLRAILLHRTLLDPRRHGFYALQLFSHKVLRRLMGIPLVLLAFSSVALWPRGPLYRVAVAGQAAFYVLAAIGLMPGRAGRRVGRHKAFSLPAFFCLATAASLQATWNVVRGRRIERWEPARERGVQ